MFMVSGAHESYAVSNVLTISGNAKMLLNGEPFTLPRSGRNEPELAAMKVYVGQPKLAKEILDSLGVPVIAPPGLLEADNAPRLAAGSGNFQHPR